MLPTDTSAVQAAGLPCLTCADFLGTSTSDPQFCTVLTPGKLYIVAANAATTWAQLLRIAQSIEVADCCMSLFSMYGQRLARMEAFEAVMIAVPEDPDIPVFPLLHLARALPQLRLHVLDGGLALTAPADFATDVWLGIPFHLLIALGWRSDLHRFPPQPDEPFFLTMVPLSSQVHLSTDRLQALWRDWLFVALLERDCGLCGGQASCQVEVQIVARKIWLGSLPMTLCMQTVEQWWRDASAVCGLPPANRVFSGPFPQPADTTISALLQATASKVIRKNGRLLITVHPECVGGGAKADTANWVKTRAASACLTAGLDLECTTAFIDQLAASAGIPRLTSSLQGAPSSDRWSQLVALAQQVGVPCPAISSKAAGVANKLKKAQQRKKHQLRCDIKARDVQLCPGFFLNADETHAQILDVVQPGASGVMLTDEDEAQELLPALKGVQPDELCLVVLGHTCPEPATCAGRISIPAQARSDQALLLLAGCYHNVGGKPVKAKPQTDIEVDLPEVLCCSFEAYADEFESEHWLRFTQAPVKTAQEILAKSGVQSPFANPWGRQFFAGDRPAAPASADKLVFQARVFA